MARVLVVDDDESIRFLLRTVLELQDYDVVEAENGAEALLYYQADPVDVVITDMLMPVMDGQELMIELQRAFPEVKLIAISGGRRSLDIAKTFTRYVFEKPFSLETILDTVHGLVSASMPAVLGHSAAGAVAMSHGVQVMA